jgi:hypothetical protein
MGQYKYFKEIGTIQLAMNKIRFLLEVNYSSRYPGCWRDETGHSIVLARPSYGEETREHGIE